MSDQRHKNFHINTRLPIGQARISDAFTFWMKQKMFGQWWEWERRQLLLTRGIQDVYFIGVFTAASSAWTQGIHLQTSWNIIGFRVPMSHCFTGHHSAFSLRLSLVSKVHFFFCPLLITKELFRMLQLETRFPVHQGFHASLRPQKLQETKHRVWEKIS